jgi:hypothetical protein
MMNSKLSKVEAVISARFASLSAFRTGGKVLCCQLYVKREEVAVAGA